LLALRKAEFEKERKAKREQGYSQSIKQQVAEKNAEKKQLRDLKVQYKSMNCEDKLDLLVKNYDVLIKADKSQKENRTGKQQICRMQGSVTQSYFILDVPSNKVGRQIYYEIAEEYRGLSKAIHQGGKYERDDSEEDDEAGETESRGATSSNYGMSISTNKQPYGDRRDGKKKKAPEI